MKVLARLCIQLYRWGISPLLRPSCRFYPTCSHYALECFERFSFTRAIWYTLSRLMRCHPWHPGGADPVPDRH